MKSRLLSLRFKKEYFLVLLPAFFVFHGYNENASIVYPSDAVQLFFKYLIGIIALTFLFSLVFASWRKGAVYVAIVMSFYFFFGAVHDFSKKNFPDLFFNKYIFILPVSFLAICVFSFFIKKSGKSFIRFTNFSNVLLVALIFIEIVVLCKNLYLSPKSVNVSPTNFVACDTCDRPDIYFIIADGYAGDEELRTVFRYDNSAFQDSLSSLGFHIISKSKSNYNLTPYSVTSIFNADYNKVVSLKENKEDLTHCFSTINNNLLSSFLQSRNYKIINHSIFRFADVPPLMNSQFLTIGQDAIASETFLGRLNRDIRFHLITRFKWRWEMSRAAKKGFSETESMLKKTMDVAASSSGTPRFVYAHFMAPHYPYYVNKKGEYKPEMILEENWFKQKEYIEYLQYWNKRFIELVHHILSASKKPPIIVFMSDHGFREFDTNSVDTSYYFMNMSTVYLPDKKYKNFYNGMSNVNLVRTILNTAFSQQLPLLKDSSIFIR